MPSEHRPLSLADLPDDILFLVLRDLDTARDVAHVSRTCRRLHLFMQGRGWRSFALQSFPWLRPAARPRPRSDDADNDVDDDDDDTKTNGGFSSRTSTQSDWSRVAQSLTWQSRAWDRRALSFQALLPRGNLQARQRRQASFRPPLAVHFQAAGNSIFDGEEMVVWGAGEDVVARYRSRGDVPTSRRGRRADDDDHHHHHHHHYPTNKPVATWKVLDGKSAGFRPGHDDVRSIAVVSHALGQPRRRGILAGRGSGSLALVSGETDGSFGQLLAQFRPEGADAGGRPVDSSRLYSLDVSAAGGRHSLVAATTPSHVLFYPTWHDTTSSTKNTKNHNNSNNSNNNNNITSGTHGTARVVDIAPTSVFDIAGVGLGAGGRQHAYNARWMAADGLLALGMITETNPLSYLLATPSGLTRTAAAKNDQLVRRFDQASSSSSSPSSSSATAPLLLLPSSLEPVGRASIAGGNGQLLLSAWSDGRIRLQDLRTPSPWDRVYEDTIQLVGGARALLSWDSERFVAGSQEDAALVIFDLRWPRRYHHTAALPCSGRLPFPNPPEIDRLLVDTYARSPQPRHRLPPLPPPGGRCGASSRRHHRCRWHAASELLLYRPNGSLFLRRSLAPHVPNPVVWSLARAANTDVAPANFYAGLNGCIVEGALFGDDDDDDSGGDGAPPKENAGTQTTTACAPYFGYPDVLDQLPPSLVPPPPPGQMSAAAWRQQQRDLVRNHHYYRTIDMHVSMLESGDGAALPASQRFMLPPPRMRFSKGGRRISSSNSSSSGGGGGGGSRGQQHEGNTRVNRATGTNNTGSGSSTDSTGSTDDPRGHNSNGNTRKANVVQLLGRGSVSASRNGSPPPPAGPDLRRIQHRLDATYHEPGDFGPLSAFEKNQQEAEAVWQRELDRELDREREQTTGQGLEVI